MRLSLAKIILLGTGGHAKVLADILLQKGQEIVATVSPGERSDNFPLATVSHYTEDESVHEFSPDEHYLVNGIGFLPETTLRERLFVDFKEKGFSFFSVVSPHAVVSPFATLAEGVQVMAGAIIQAGTAIASNSIINTGAQVDHDCIVGAHSHIAPSATLCGHVTVGNNVHIGAGATVIQSINIESRAIIGVGANVVCNVKPSAKVYGARSQVVNGDSK